MSRAETRGKRPPSGDPGPCIGSAIDALEAVEWGAVPGVSAATAASFTARLREAQAELEGGE